MDASIDTKQYADDLKYGDRITGDLVISPYATIPDSVFYPFYTSSAGIVPFEQGPNWYYGVQITYNKGALDTTQVAIEAALTAILGATCAPSLIYTLPNLVDDLWDIVKNKDAFDLTVVETCTFKHEGEMYQHHHILEYYADGVLAYVNAFSYHSNEGPHPRWEK